MADTDCRYVQLEKEYHGIVFACETFLEYISGVKTAPQTTTGNNKKEFEGDDTENTKTDVKNTEI